MGWDLARRLAPQPEESFLGFLRRVGAHNGFADVGDFLSWCGARYDRALIEHVEVVERQLGLAGGELSCRVPVDRPREPARDRRFERRSVDPVCPACLAENRPRHAAWRHALVTACPHHGAVLLDRCPRCREPLGLNRGAHLTCACGFPLSMADTVAATEIEIGVSALVADTECSARGHLFAPLNTITPADVGRFLFFLGSRELSFRTGKLGKAWTPATLDQSRDFLAPAFHLLTAWPEHFDAHIARRLRNGPADATTAMGKLGNWGHALARFRGAAYEAVRERVFVVAAEVLAEPARQAPYRTYLPTGRERASGWTSATAAARELGMRVDRIVEAVRADLVPGRLDHRGFGHRRIEVSRETVREIAQARDRFLSASAAADLLGLSRKGFKRLRDAEVIAEVDVDDRPPLVDGGFDRQHLLAFVDGLRSGERAGEALRCVRFRDIDHRQTTDRAALTAVLRDIAAGEIRPLRAAPDASLDDFLFDAEELHVRLKAHRNRATLTTRQIERLTGWKADTVRAWRRAGMLPAGVDANASAAADDVDVAGLVAFLQAYVPLSALATATGRSSRGVARRLQSAGVALHGGGRDGVASRGAVVAIADLARVAFEATDRTAGANNTPPPHQHSAASTL